MNNSSNNNNSDSPSRLSLGLPSSSSNAPRSSATSNAPHKHLLLSPSSAAATATSMQAQAVKATSQTGSNAADNDVISTVALNPADLTPGEGGPPAGINENEKVYWLIVELLNPQTREAALLELSKKREQWDDLALVLWHSFG
jgi:hypothetical protein